MNSIFIDTLLQNLQSNTALAQDPIFLGVFFVLGYRKLFSDTSNTTFGSILLLAALSVTAARFVKSINSQFNQPVPAPPIPHTPPAQPTPPSQPAQTQQTRQTPLNEYKEDEEGTLSAILSQLLQSYTSKSD